jgi:hypothetical protein
MTPHQFPGTGIHMKLITGYRRDESPADFVKYSVREYDSGRRGPAEAFKPGRPLSDISEDAPTLLTEQPFCLTKSLAAQLQVNRELMKRTHVDVLGMRNPV